MPKPVERTIVLKFGGAAVASTWQFSRIAEIVARRKTSYGRVVGIVSAMGGTADSPGSIIAEGGGE